MSRTIDPEAFGFLITDTARLLRSEADRRVNDSGLELTHGEARALAHAARAGAVRQNVLAERMGIEAMTLSGQLDRLEARGLITRSPDPSDRRAKLIELTDNADTMLGEIYRISLQLLSEVNQEFDPAEWKQFMSTLKRVRDRFMDLRSGEEGKTA
jgi:MarR family transcriptional regulator, transcriptional regulator for hemolysin